LTHYIPQDNIYVYFRTQGKETVMEIMTGNATEKKLKTDRFAESMIGKTKGKNVLTDESIQNLGEIALPAMTTLILELE